MKRIDAYILEENEVSKKSFLQSGFIFKGIKEYDGTEHLLFEKKISQEGKK